MTLRHAFVDESIRNDGWYRLTVATIAARDVNAVVRDLRSLRPEGRQRLHFSSEGDAVRHRILDGIMRLPVSATTFAAPYRRGRNDDLARRRCLEAMVGHLAPEVALLVLDSRGPHRDAADRRVLRGALASRSVLDGVSYVHRGSRDEPMLALPDVFGWAVGAGGRFSAKVSPVVDQVFLGEGG